MIKKPDINNSNQLAFAMMVSETLVKVSSFIDAYVEASVKAAKNNR